MFSRLLTRARPAVRPVKPPRRKLGGHAHAEEHHAAHAKHGPYEPHHEPSIYGSTPLPFGVGPNYKFEGWEIPLGITYATVFSLFVYGELRTDNETALEWARREAIARKKVVDNGGEVKFGKYYMYTTFEEKDRSEKFASQHEVKRIDFKYEEEEE